MIGRDRDAVPDREAVELAAGSAIPCRLMRLAQAGQVEAERAALLVEEAMPSDP